MNHPRISLRYALGAPLVVLALLMAIAYFDNRPQPVPLAERSDPAIPPTQTSPGSAAPLNPAPADIPETAIEDFDRWLDGYANVAPSNRSVLLPEGFALVEERRARLKQLITTDPEAALSAALPDNLRQSLPVALRVRLEEPIHTAGRYEVEAICFDPLYPGGQLNRFAVVDERRYEVHTYGQRLGVTSKDTLSLHGIAIDDQMALSDDPLRLLSETERRDRKIPAGNLAAEVRGRVYLVDNENTLAEIRNLIKEGELRPGHNVASGYASLDNGELEGVSYFGEEEEGASAAPAEESPRTEGAKTMLYIRCRLADDAVGYEPVSDANAASRQAVVESYWEANSFGKSTLSTTITTVLDLPGTYDYYRNQNPTSVMRNDAKAAAIAANPTWDESLFDFYTVVTRGGWPYSGVAAVGGRWSHLVPGGTQSGIAAHEFGHNLGFTHSNYWLTDSPSPIGQDSVPGGFQGDADDDERIEYGHRFDLMGSAGTTDAHNGRSHYAPSGKNLIDWLVEADGDIATVTTSGSTRLYRHDITQSDLATYTPNVVRGIKIDVDSNDYVNTGDPRRYWLGYRTQPTNGNSETWLPHGLQVDWVRDGKPNQAVQIDMSPYSQSNPTSTANREDAVLIVGRTYTDEASDIHFTATAEGGTSPNQWLDVVVNLGTQAANTAPTATLTPDAFQVSTGIPVNFTSTSNDADFDTLAYWWDFDDYSFEPTSLNSPTTSHRWSSAGFYTVRLTVSDMKGGRAVKSVVIQVGNPSNTSSIAGRVLQGGLPVADAIISIDGTATTWTLSDGTYFIPGLADGSYQVAAARLNATFTPQFTTPVILAGLNATGIDFFADGGLGSTTSTLAVSPHTITVPNGANLQFVANAWDNSGAPIASSPIWSTAGGGTINASGLFSATTLGGPFTVTATDSPLTADAFITVVDNLSLGLEVLDGNAVEGTPDTALIRVHRYGDTTNAITANFTVTGSATEGSDFATLGTSVPISAGASFVDVTITSLNDFAIESAEDVTLTLQSDPAYTIFAQQRSATATIDDDGLDIAPQVTIVSPTSALTIILEGNALALESQSTDDGFPSALTHIWSTLSAPPGGLANFSSADALETIATFTQVGTYTLRITASDSVNSDSADVEVYVAPYPWAPPSTTDQIIYYTMDEGSGTTATDAIGADHNGTLANGAAWTAVGGGISGTAIVLDGTNDQIDIANASEINSSNQDYRTISIWFKADDPLATAKQVIYEEGGAGKGLNIYLDSGMLYVGGWNDGSNGWNTTFLGTPLTDTAWHHVALVLDSGGETTLQANAFFGYLDGIEFDRGSASRLSSHTGNIAIGARRNATSYHDGDSSGNGDRFDGCVDEFFLWNRPLFPDEIRQLCARDGRVPGLALGGSTESRGARIIPSNVGIILDGSSMGPGVLSAQWAQEEGPTSGVATFADATSPDTTATFNLPGFYALQVTADAGTHTVSLPVPLHVGIDTAANPTTTNQVIHYALDEGSGATATDGVGANHNGTIQGSAAWTGPTGGISGTALIFDGTDDQVDIADSGDINTSTSGERTIALWFKADNPASTIHQVLYEEGGATRGLNLYLHSGALYVGGWSNGTNGWVSTFLSITINDTNWHHVVLVLDAPGTTTLTADAFCGYLDGVEFARGSAAAITSHTGDIAIGAMRDATKFHDGNSSGSGNFFAGYIDEFHLFNNRALSIDEIGLLYSFNNIGPAVDAGPDQPSIAGLATTLAGSRSDDGKGTAPLTQSWSVEVVPAGGSLLLSNPDGQGIETEALAATSGTHRLRLRASDGVITTFDDVNLTFSVLAAYDLWIATFSTVPAGERDYLSTPSGTGYTNLELYAFGGDPTSITSLADAVPAAAVIGDGGSNYLELTYRRRIDAATRGLSYTPVFSTDLAVWSSTGATEVSVTPIDADFESVTIRFDTPISADSRRFCSVRIDISK